MMDWQVLAALVITAASLTAFFLMSPAAKPSNTDTLESDLDRLPPPPAPPVRTSLDDELLARFAAALRESRGASNNGR